MGRKDENGDVAATRYVRHKPNKGNYRHRFDFEIGSLVKSPCRGCPTRHRFPRCMDDCQVLDGIHTLLANAVSCTRRR